MTATATAIRKRLDEGTHRDAGEGFHEYGFRALGSACELFYRADASEEGGTYRSAALDWLAAFEAQFSRFLPDSLVSRINDNAGVGWTETDAQTDLLLDLCEHHHFITQGAFDATSLPLSELWDWKRRHDSLPGGDEIAAAKARVGWKRIQRAPGRIFLPEPGMKLDFGGVGKEFAVDCLIQLAAAHGIEDVMVDLGGDIAVLGEPPEGGGWYIGLEDPSQEGKTYCGIRLRSGGAVATSGDYRRCFELDGQVYGHIIDSRTGWPVGNGTRSVSVIAPRCTMAGLLATSAMIIGGQDAIAMLERTPGVQASLWCKGRHYETRGFRRCVLPQGWDDEVPGAVLQSAAM